MSIRIDGTKLKKTIISKGETTKSIAKKLDKSEQSVKLWIKNNRMPKMACIAITSTLKVDENYFAPPTPEQEKAAADATQRRTEYAELREKIEYVNRNLCELIDRFNEFAEAWK